ncbi:MAG: hypothetical protein JW734_00680 [Candidatus Omnitrophica bacterium]|nr:hypothetical protein [Candidatus Omnitrophota bacterium]
MKKVIIFAIGVMFILQGIGFSWELGPQNNPLPNMPAYDSTQFSLQDLKKLSPEEAARFLVESNLSDSEIAKKLLDLKTDSIAAILNEVDMPIAVEWFRGLSRDKQFGVLKAADPERAANYASNSVDEYWYLAEDPYRDVRHLSHQFPDKNTKSLSIDRIVSILNVSEDSQAPSLFKALFSEKQREVLKKTDPKRAASYLLSEKAWWIDQEGLLSNLDSVSIAIILGEVDQATALQWFKDLPGRKQAGVIEVTDGVTFGDIEGLTVYQTAEYLLGRGAPAYEIGNFLSGLDTRSIIGVLDSVDDDTADNWFSYLFMDRQCDVLDKASPANALSYLLYEGLDVSPYVLLQYISINSAVAILNIADEQVAGHWLEEFPLEKKIQVLESSDPGRAGEYLLWVTPGDGLSVEFRLSGAFSSLGTSSVLAILNSVNGWQAKVLFNDLEQDVQSRILKRGRGTDLRHIEGISSSEALVYLSDLGLSLFEASKVIAGLDIQLLAEILDSADESTAAYLFGCLPEGVQVKVLNNTRPERAIIYIFDSGAFLRQASRLVSNIEVSLAVEILGLLDEPTAVEVFNYLLYFSEDKKQTQILKSLGIEKAAKYLVGSEYVRRYPGKVASLLFGSDVSFIIGILNSVDESTAAGWFSNFYEDMQRYVLDNVDVAGVKDLREFSPEEAVKYLSESGFSWIEKTKLLRSLYFRFSIIEILNAADESTAAYLFGCLPPIVQSDVLEDSSPERALIYLSGSGLRDHPYDLGGRISGLDNSLLIEILNAADESTAAYLFGCLYSVQQSAQVIEEIKPERAVKCLLFTDVEGQPVFWETKDIFPRLSIVSSVAILKAADESTAAKWLLYLPNAKRVQVLEEMGR